MTAAALVLIAMAMTYTCQSPIVVDGDTIDCGVLPLQIGIQPQLAFLNVRFRFENVNAPEVKTPEGRLARSALADFVGRGEVLTVLTRWAREKYGRYLGTFFLGSTNLSEWMLAQGHAQACKGSAC